LTINSTIVAADIVAWILITIEKKRDILVAEMEILKWV
jgi:hypothetical protein